jgi:mono/diheme cytochrome c family protein
MKWRHWLLRGVLVVGALLVLAQLVPYGRVENPPVRAEPAWNSPRTRELVARSCFDCHSNQSKRQWYHVAPASWLVAYDVEEAREHLNFSEWDREQEHAHEAAEEVAEGEMPLWYYLLAHPEARLSDAERAELVAGLEATLGREGDEAERGDGGGGTGGGGGRGRGRGRGRGAGG